MLHGFEEQKPSYRSKIVRSTSPPPPIGRYSDRDIVGVKRKRIPDSTNQIAEADSGSWQTYYAQYIERKMGSALECCEGGWSSKQNEGRQHMASLFLLIYQFILQVLTRWRIYKILYF